MDPRAEINEYDLGLPVPLAAAEARRRAVPVRVWERVREAKAIARAILGDRLRDVRLFGSYARGQFDEDSDADVLVVADDLLPGEERRLVDELCALTRGDLVVSPLVMSAARLEELRRREMILAADIDREGLSV